MTTGKQRSVHPAAAVIPIFFGLACAVIHWLGSRQADDGLRIAEAAGAGVASFALPSFLGLFVAMIVWFASGKKQMASTIAFSLAAFGAGVLMTGQAIIGSVGSRSESTQAVDHLKKASGAIMKDDGTADIAGLEKAFGDAAAMTDGDEARTYGAMQRVLAKGAAVQKTYHDAIAEQQEAGLFEYTLVPDLEALRGHRKAVAELERLRAAAADFSANIDGHFETELQKENLSPGARARIMKGFAEGRAGAVEETARINAIEQEILANLDRAMAILEEHWGSWEADEAGMAVFSRSVPREVFDEFSELVTSVPALYEEQQQIQRALVAQQQRMLR